MSKPTHISHIVNNWFAKRFFDHLLDKYQAKSLDELHIRMFNKLEQEIYFKIINKKRGN